MLAGGVPPQDRENPRFVTPWSHDDDVDPYMSMPELVVGVVHQRVFEAFWDGPDTFPTRVVVDDVLN